MQWISVNDKIAPDVKHNNEWPKAIVITNYGNIAICRYDPYAKYWVLDSVGLGCHEVTHWMPLPEPPHESRED